jgi:hypothetical protein
LSVRGLLGSAPTKNSRKCAAVGSRAIAPPFPSIVMSLAIGASALGPYQLLSRFSNR